MDKPEFNPDGSLKLPEKLQEMKKAEIDSVVLRRVQIRENNPAIAQIRIEFPKTISVPSGIIPFYHEISEGKFPSVNHSIRKQGDKIFLIEVKEGTMFMYSLLQYLLFQFKSWLSEHYKVVVRGSWTKFDV